MVVRKGYHVATNKIIALTDDASTYRGFAPFSFRKYQRAEGPKHKRVVSKGYYL